MITDAADRARRRSPIRFDATPIQVERRDDWDVVLAYEGDQGPWLVDLSHRKRWDFQDGHIGDHQPLGMEVPPAPGVVSVERGLMISRMNGTQASSWHVGPDEAPSPPDEVSLTDTTDSHCWLAVVGAATPFVMEHVSSLDLFPPGRLAPFLTQGPVLHVACQIVTCGPDGALIALARGYGQTFADAMLHAAREVGLRPGGERVFTNWWLRTQGNSP